MRTAPRNDRLYLVGEGCIPCTTPPLFCHAQPPLPRMPPLSPCMPSLCHAPPLCHTCPPFTTYAPQVCTPPGATMHAPREQPCMPPWEQPGMPPPQEQPGMAPQSNHACPPGATTHPPGVCSFCWNFEWTHTNLKFRRHRMWSLNRQLQC